MLMLYGSPGNVTMDEHLRGQDLGVQGLQKAILLVVHCGLALVEEVVFVIQ